MKRMHLEKALHNTGKMLLAVAILALVLCGCGNAAGEGATESVASKTDAVEAVSESASSGTDVVDAVDVAKAASDNADTETTDDAKEAEPAANTGLTEEKPQEESMLHLLIDGEEVNVAWEDNETVDALSKLAQSEPLTISMSGYGGFEQVGAIGTSLPKNDVQMTTTAGDIVLYAGNQIVVFYGSNSWAYTKLGRITDKNESELKDLLGNGDVTITLQTENTEQVRDADRKGTGAFDFEKKTVLLNSGYEMPIMGLGTYSLDHDTCVNSVKTLLESGGRLIDTAYMYHNEEAVGEGVRQAMEEYGIAREDIFVITKIYPSQFGDPEAAIELALEKLDIGYVDMMLLHHPGSGDVEAYKAMERYVEDGRIRSIGLSNWYIEELTAFLPQITIMPALVQNEIHPYYQEQEVVPFIQEKGIVMQGWYPLGGRGHTAELLGDDVISAIAKAHDVSPAQVILRWNLQRGIVVIPGSSNPDHIRENLDLFGFELTQEEMDKIAALDRGEKHDWY